VQRQVASFDAQLKAVYGMQAPMQLRMVGSGSNPPAATFSLLELKSRSVSLVSLSFFIS
jgi:hypothetical protein